MDDGIIKEIIDQSEGVLDKAYDDIVHPIAEPVGQIISYLPRTIRLFLQSGRDGSSMVRRI